MNLVKLGIVFLVMMPLAVSQSASPSVGVAPSADAFFSIKTVTAGNTHDNNDVFVSCDTGSTGDITVDPETGTVNSNSTVVFKSHAEGSVTGLETGDVVEVRSNGKARLTGTGGTISVTGSDASATITNTNPPGGASITATGPGGTSVTIPPGSTATITT
ncbi:MAG TPA: hypothetical protein VK550_16210 [Polyangiaceae bacterium]|nr:hypothetical protein [Polyangiaceae bacterium]